MFTQILKNSQGKSLKEWWILSERNFMSVCRNCPCCCGLIVCMKGNEVIEVKGNPEHPVNNGFICIKGKALRQLLNDENRLKYPLAKIKGEWKRVSWDEALSIIASKLLEVKEKYSAQALAFCGGFGLRPMYGIWSRFCNVYGTPNNVNAGDCAVSKMLAHTVTYGTMASPRWAILGYRDDYRKNTQCMVIWGANPPQSHPAGAEIFFHSREKA